MAAIWVVLFHAFEGKHITNLAHLFPHWFRIVVFERGNLGVAIFFVLSGFVIAHSLREARVTWSYFARFILRRSLRLDPPYFVSIAIVLGLAFISAGVKREVFVFPEFRALAAHMVYLQGLLQIEQINDVYWTLCYEVQFYLVLCALFGLSQRLPQIGSKLLFISTAVVSLIWGLGIYQENLLSGLFVNLWYGFLLGVFGYWAYTKRLSIMWFYLYAVSILLSGFWRSDLFALVCVGTSILLVTAVDKNWLSWNGFQFLGSISYSLYLIHNPVTGASFYVLRKVFIGTAFQEAIMLFLTLCLCIIASYVVWRLVELPCVRYSRRIELNPRRDN